MQLAQMSRWYVVSRAIHTVAKLGIADHMSTTPTSVDDIAVKTSTNASALNRLLRFLSAYDLFKQHESGFSLTELSLPLKKDSPNSIKDVLLMADDSWWEAFAHLDNSIKTGGAAFTHQHGDDFFSYLSKHPEKQNNFDRGMAKLSTYDDDNIAKSYPFETFKSIIDLGAGRGGLVKAINKRYPNIPITLFDTDAVISQLNAADYARVITLETGSFFAEIPARDAYLFKGVLHDFNDEDMRKILSNTRNQIPKSSKLLIIEQVMPDDDKPHPNKTMDIVMMVLLAGRQRTLQEWQDIVNPIGFRFLKSHPTESIFSIMVFEPS